MDAQFWSRVDVGGSNQCWPWKMSLDKDGYGKCNHKRYPSQRSHRVAWMSSNPGENTPEQVMHTCDNPRCCNPAHLVAGTALDNNRDRDAKGRRADLSGDRNPMARLTWPIVEDIRRSRETGSACARRVGCSQATVSLIRSGRIWKVKE